MLQIKNAIELKSTELDQLYQIIINAYAATEDTMWGKNYVRITKIQFQDFVMKEEFLVAVYNQKVAGGLRIHSPEKEVMMFSLFGVAFNWSGHGIGWELMKEVERIAKERKMFMLKIELLRTRANDLPDKIRLANWYKRFGFVFTGAAKFEEIKPKVPQPIVPCDFDYYQKLIKT